MRVKGKREQDICRRKRQCDSCKRVMEIGEPVTVITYFGTEEKKKYLCNKCAYEQE